MIGKQFGQTESRQDRQRQRPAGAPERTARHGGRTQIGPRLQQPAREQPHRVALAPERNELRKLSDLQADPDPDHRSEQQQTENLPAEAEAPASFGFHDGGWIGGHGLSSRRVREGQS